MVNIYFILAGALLAAVFLTIVIVRRVLRKAKHKRLRNIGPGLEEMPIGEVRRRKPDLKEEPAEENSSDMKADFDKNQPEEGPAEMMPEDNVRQFEEYPGTYGSEMELPPAGAAPSIEIYPDLAPGLTGEEPPETPDLETLGKFKELQKKLEALQQKNLKEELTGTKSSPSGKGAKEEFPDTAPGFEGGEPPEKPEETEITIEELNKEINAGPGNKSLEPAVETEVPPGAGSSPAGRKFAGEEAPDFKRFRRFERGPSTYRRQSAERPFTDRNRPAMRSNRGGFGAGKPEPGIKRTPIGVRSYPVSFKTIWEALAVPDQWSTMLVYLYEGKDGFNKVMEDIARRKEKNIEYGEDLSVSSRAVRRETEILIVPEAAGIRFNPPCSRILWLEDCHCAEFRMQILSETAYANPYGVFNGKVSFYIGALLIGENKIRLGIGNDSSFVSQMRKNGSLLRENDSSSYRNIFVSYSHEDSRIVELLEKAYRALGDQYLRDVRMLRSGENWSDKILDMIETADIFQLCWSAAAKKSKNVEQEWRHALSLNREYFLRPTYWERPMPDPPDELSKINFSYLDI